MRYHGGRGDCLRIQQPSEDIPLDRNGSSTVGGQQDQRPRTSGMGDGWLDRGAPPDLGESDGVLCAQTPVLTLIQCSHDENFAWMNRIDDNRSAVKLANPKTAEYQVIRTSLLPGLLKTIRENRQHALPIQVFEASDVVFKDPSAERQASNRRNAAAIWCNKTAGFEVVCGLLDRIMAMLEIPRIFSSKQSSATHGYYLKEVEGMLPLGCLTDAETTA